MTLMLPDFPLWFLESTVGAVDRTQGAFIFPDDRPSIFTRAVGPEIALVSFTSHHGAGNFALRLGVTSVSLAMISSPRELRDLCNRFREHCTLLLIDPDTRRERGIKLGDVMSTERTDELYELEFHRS